MFYIYVRAEEKPSVALPATENATAAPNISPSKISWRAAKRICYTGFIYILISIALFLANVLYGACRSQQTLPRLPLRQYRLLHIFRRVCSTADDACHHIPLCAICTADPRYAMNEASRQFKHANHVHASARLLLLGGCTARSIPRVCRGPDAGGGGAAGRASRAQSVLGA